MQNTIKQAELAIAVCREHGLTPVRFRCCDYEQSATIVLDCDQFQRLFAGQSVDRQRLDHHYVYRKSLSGVTVEYWERHTAVDAPAHETVTIGEEAPCKS